MGTYTDKNGVTQEGYLDGATIHMAAGNWIAHARGVFLDSDGKVLVTTPYTNQIALEADSDATKILPYPVVFTGQTKNGMNGTGEDHSEVFRDFYGDLHYGMTDMWASATDARESYQQIIINDTKYFMAKLEGVRYSANEPDTQGIHLDDYNGAGIRFFLNSPIYRNIDGYHVRFLDSEGNEDGRIPDITVLKTDRRNFMTGRWNEVSVALDPGVATGVYDGSVEITALLRQKPPMDPNELHVANGMQVYLRDSE